MNACFQVQEAGDHQPTGDNFFTHHIAHKIAFITGDDSLLPLVWTSECYEETELL